MPRRPPSCWRASVERCWEPMLPSCPNPLSCSHTQSQRPLTEESKSCSQTILQSDKIAYKSWISLRNGQRFFVSTVSYSGKGFRSRLAVHPCSASCGSCSAECLLRRELPNLSASAQGEELVVAISKHCQCATYKRSLNSLNAEFWMSLP